tara:strand:- start:149 stop:346 length:198 start_codon:yes stop_codon:yes gene_type:complete
MPRAVKNALLLMLVGTRLISIHVLAAELSNSKILGAIPNSFDNIGIVRYEDMDAGIGTVPGDSRE